VSGKFSSHKRKVRPWQSTIIPPLPQRENFLQEFEKQWFAGRNIAAARLL
jgi:hypothetical protein